MPSVVIDSNSAFDRQVTSHNRKAEIQYDKSLFIFSIIFNQNALWTISHIWTDLHSVHFCHYCMFLMKADSTKRNFPSLKCTLQMVILIIDSPVDYFADSLDLKSMF